MKFAEMLELTSEELNTQIQDTNKALFDARFKHAMHQLDNPAEMGRLRHQLAQLKTVLNQKFKQA